MKCGGRTRSLYLHEPGVPRVERKVQVSASAGRIALVATDAAINANIFFIVRLLDRLVRLMYLQD
jgi:hypothetical protein